MQGGIAILVVSKWSTECSQCGNNADSREIRHEMRAMEGEGCGARFVAIGTEYVGGRFEEVVKGMRPDLPFIDVNVNRGDAVELPRGLPA